MYYEHLFSKGKIGTLEIKNRIVMPAMGVALANPDATMSDEMIAFYEERAKGGAGLIVTEVTRVNNETGVAQPRQISVAGDNLIPGLKKLTDAIHRHGTKIFVQLYHPGCQGIAIFMKDGMDVSPSGVASTLIQQPCRALTTEEIKNLVQDFINGAARAKKAGIDGVEIHCAHGYLLNQFLSPYTNQRKDEYGGSTEKRAQIVKEIILGIRERCGRDYPVTMRISVDEFLRMTSIQADGILLEEGIRLCKYLSPFGLDAISVTSGIYESMNIAWEPISYAQGWRLYLAEAIKKEVAIPVFTAGVYRSPEFCERIIAEGKADFVGIARGQLADPAWANKARQGRAYDIRRCISCLYCMESLIINSAKNEPLECAINPRAARELQYNHLREDGAGKMVVILGGGPSGMEAAVTLARRGFKPVLFEKSGELGGQLKYGCKPPQKDKILWLVQYYITQLEELRVDIRLNTAPTMEEIKALSPYAVFVATGAQSIVPDSIPGIHGNNVSTNIDVLSGKTALTYKRVAVIGSGLTGLETAHLLVEQGNTVTVIEMMEGIGGDAYWQNVSDVMMHLKENNVHFLPKHKLCEIKQDKIILERTDVGDMVELQVDAVVLSLGVYAGKQPLEAIQAAFANVKSIGDVSRIGRIGNAVRTGFIAAYELPAC